MKYIIYYYNILYKHKTYFRASLELPAAPLSIRACPGDEAGAKASASLQDPV